MIDLTGAGELIVLICDVWATTSILGVILWLIFGPRAGRGRA